MAPSRLSVIVTCHNQQEFIADAIDSVLRQIRPSDEVIVVDDASSDGSAGLLQRYGSAIQLITFAANRGALEARNAGARAASGDYLVFLDGDDLLTPWALDTYDRVIAECKPKLILGNTQEFSHGSTPALTHLDPPPHIEYLDYPTLMSKDRPVWVGASVLVVERLAFERVGGWSPGIFQMDLYDILTKLGQLGRTLLVQAPVTTLYRIHESNTIHTVKPFIQMAHRILQKERSGKYYRPPGHSFQRSAWFGGMVAFWVKRAVRAGLYVDALGLAMSGSLMVLTAVAFRLASCIKGRRRLTIAEWPHAS